MQVGVILGGERLTWDDAYERAQDPLRAWPYPPDMLQLMQIDYTDPDREPDVDSFTPTRIMSCHRQAVLQSDSDYYIDADQAWPMVRGHMVHALMEKASYPGALTAIREQRMRTWVETKYGPQLFTAKPDLIVVNSIDPADSPDCYERDEDVPLEIHIKVVDYKSKNEIKHELTRVAFEHELQVNMYGWVASRELPRIMDLPRTRVVVDEVEIVYCDMSKVRRFTSAGYLSARGKMLTRKPKTYETLQLEPIRLWSLDKIGRFVQRRIEQRIAAKDELPPVLPDEEAWRCNYCPVRELCTRIEEGRDAA